jgi:hypothetical protein
MSNPSPTNPPLQPKPDFELELLKAEYFFLQTTIEDYNKQIWVIKALGITATGLIINLTLKENENIIALIGSVIPLFFWILESQWKHFQHGFYPRIAEIEATLRECNLRSPAIFNGWSRTFKRTPTPKRKGYLWDGLLNPSVFITYVLEIAFLLILSVVKLP